MSSLGAHYPHKQTFAHPAPSASLYSNGVLAGPSRSRTPNPASSQSGNHIPEPEQNIDDDPRSATFKNLFARSEAKLSALFGDKNGEEKDDDGSPDGDHRDAKNGAERDIEPPKSQTKKAARALDLDDYDDSDEEEEHDNNVSPLKAKSTGSSAIPRVSSPIKISGIPPSPTLTNVQGASTQWQGKSSDDVRKKLEEDKKAAEDAAKRSDQFYFYPLDNDRDAMLEQQRLEESDRQVDAEMSGQINSNATPAMGGTLSQANLGTSSLVFKHLIAQIDRKRSSVKLNDQELRSLMIEVKKDRSKWASEDRVGQEDLYEAAEKVLSEIKAQTEHSQPFLQRVNKREAPDYYTIIKHPMDLSTMTKKLKAVQYKSKQEFVNDLNLIWANCLRYNANPEHFLRRHALLMRKETERLVPLIPEIVIRDRAEVEAEERRQHAAENDLEGAEDSDDEPIISSRGRKAPGKKAKKGTNARKAPGAHEGTPGVESKPLLNGLGPRHDLLRADSDTAMDGSQNGMSTPIPGNMTPGFNGGTTSSQADPMEIDGFGGINGVGAIGAPTVDYDDPDYKTWKRVTKKDRALVALERHRLFKGDKLNVEEPALLRSKASMRRWMKKLKEAENSTVLGKRKREGPEEQAAERSGETLAEGMEGTEEKALPDYYDPISAIPDLEKRLQWLEDSEGVVVPASEETLRIVPKGLFSTPESIFSKKMTSNLRQMQETRKICNKIGVVKQMQIQSQMYQNQFQKYPTEPLIDQEVDNVVVSDDGPVMTQYVCRAGMQRSVAKIFYNAGFEECQPSALDAMTDLATDYFVKVARSLNDYLCKPRVPATETIPGTNQQGMKWKRKYTVEESVLHSLNENGIDLETLENYVKDDSDRLTSKLGTLHERMKSHLADLLRPALGPEAGPDGANAFNDGSEQFVGGDYAEDLDLDFFGFKELGLDKEFGLESLSVPLHLLQNRMHNAYRAQNASTITTTASIFATPIPFHAVTLQSLTNEIGLVHNFFQAKLHANNDEALVEDDDLPQKQRLPKPRLPPTGKITSPRKKPAREAGPGKGHPKKKMRLIDGTWIKESEIAEREKAKEDAKKGIKPGSKLKHSTSAMERTDSIDADPDMDDDMGTKKNVNGPTTEGGMMSPESLEAL